MTALPGLKLLIMSSINQDNKKELGHQVNNMKRVYENATCTLIWLGPDRKGRSKIAFNAIDRIGIYILEKSDIPRDMICRYSAWHDVVRTFRRDSYLLNCTKREIEYIRWVYEHQWFSRLWVLQEFNSSPHSKTICGASSLDSWLVALVAKWMIEVRWYHDNLKTWKLPGSHLSAAAQMLSDAVREPHVDLLRAVHYGLLYKTSDPRDRLFALLGLSYPSLMKLPLKADYTLSTFEVYKAAIQASIEENRSLRALTFVSDNSSGTPSWMPTWENPKGRSPSIIWREETLWNACADRRREVPGKLLGGVMVAEGIIIDQIHNSRKLIKSRYGIDLPVKPLTTRSKLYSIWLELLKPASQFKTHKELITAYAMALTCGYKLGSSKMAETDRLRTFTLFLSELLWTTGGYVGHGPSDTKPGDKVAILWGAEVPFILRPQPQGGFALVGEAYMHGLMDGEGVETWKNGELAVDEQTIEIR